MRHFSSHFTAACIVTLLIAGPALAQGRGDGGRQGRNQRQQDRQQRLEEGALKVGQMAPTFELKALDGKTSFSLTEFRDERPVILFFGSYT